MKRPFALSLLALFSLVVAGQQVKTSGSSLSYLGQKPPGMTPELFAPEIIATGFYERDITISPDGSEVFYGLLTGRHVTILYTRFLNGRWTEPEIAPFARNSQYFFLEPCFSADGKAVYFLSTKPPAGKEPKPGWTYQNIWASDKNEDGTWSEIYNPDTVLNRPNSQFYPSLTKTGTLYFTRSDEKTGRSEILRAKKNGNSFGPPELLPPVVNGNGNIYNAFISPDESFLIACVENKNNEINPGYSNYYIFFRDNNDNWSEGISFGPEINIKESNAISASVSPDGKYMFFSAKKTSDRMQEISSRNTLSSLREFLNSPQNGNYDIYWVSAGVIDALRPGK
ncbi:MAG: hypothetical protein MUE74_04310 [Bacteroidales bacterium]|jgi:hypothetical protein|nr:hypothetical protein [Bacteroidales bacterium]